MIGEGRADAAVRVGEALGVDFRSPQEKAPGHGCPAARCKRAGHAHRPQVPDQREERIVAHRVGLGVGHRQGEARPLQQCAHVADIGEGNDARAGAAGQLGLGGKQRLAQLLQRAAAGNSGQEQPVRLQRPARPG